MNISRLLALPCELRNRIYELVAPAEVITVDLQMMKPAEPCWELLAASKQIFIEYLPIYQDRVYKVRMVEATVLDMRFDRLLKTLIKLSPHVNTIKPPEITVNIRITGPEEVEYCSLNRFVESSDCFEFIGADKLLFHDAQVLRVVHEDSFKVTINPDSCDLRETNALVGDIGDWFERPGGQKGQLEYRILFAVCKAVERCPKDELEMDEKGLTL